MQAVMNNKFQHLNKLINFFGNRKTLLNESKIKHFKPNYSTENTKFKIKPMGKDILLYKNDNDKFFKLLNLFAICQWLSWSFLAETAYTTMKDVKPNFEAKPGERLPWWKTINFGEYKSGIVVGGIILGFGTLAMSWLYTSHHIKYLVLRKNNTVSFVTYTPILIRPLKHRMFETHLNNISAKSTRLESTSSISLKVRGKYFHYLLDMKGEFVNPKLFDSTAGLQRRF